MKKIQKEKKRIIFIEMLNCLNDLNKQLFTNYESYDYFLFNIIQKMIIIYFM